MPSRDIFSSGRHGHKRWTFLYPRTLDDKRKAVEGALEHEKGNGRTDSAISEHCGVGTDLVRWCREGLESTHRIGASSKRVGKDGKTMTSKSG